MSSPTPNIKCRSCNVVLNFATCAATPSKSGRGMSFFPRKQPVPKPGDLTLCAECGEISKFNDDLTAIVPLDMGELAKIHASAPETYDVLISARDHLRSKGR